MRVVLGDLPTPLGRWETPPLGCCEGQCKPGSPKPGYWAASPSQAPAAKASLDPKGREGTCNKDCSQAFRPQTTSGLYSPPCPLFPCAPATGFSVVFCQAHSCHRASVLAVLPVRFSHAGLPLFMQISNVTAEAFQDDP